MYKIKVHKQFLKDLKKAKLNQSNIEKLFHFVSCLTNNNPMPPEAKDHTLLGEWEDTREFHISGDLLVIYRKNDNLKEIQLLRRGKPKFIVLPIEEYEKLKEAELEKIIREAEEDYKLGRFIKETAEEHFKRLEI